MLELFNIEHLLEQQPWLHDKIARQCTGCRICQKECAFLTAYGTPGHIARALNSGIWNDSTPAFSCSLCGLCSSLCPADLDPLNLFLELRRQAVRSGNGTFGAHQRMIRYEKRGKSDSYTLYKVPKNCDTVFFPGCALPGARPDTTLQTLHYLLGHHKNVGVVLDCCTKPSHDLGRTDDFNRMFSRLKRNLLERGVQTVITACPSCHGIFMQYAPEFEIRTVYDVIAEQGVESPVHLSGEIVIHDPCATRFESHIHDAVRRIIQKTGMTIIETGYERENTICCGEGGAAGCIAPQFERQWTDRRISISGGRRIVSYCAGCVGLHQRKTRAVHLLDLVFAPEKALKNRAKASQSPFTYLNRLRLKSKIQKQFAL